jgi:hypothetical protein
MKARRLFIAAMWFNLLAISATAETIVVRPDYCAASADAPKIVSLRDVEAADLNPDRAAGKVLVLYPVETDGWAAARILARFDLEGANRSRLPRFCRTAR